MNKKTLITRNAIEIIGEKYLDSTLKRKNNKVYCGYEPSGEIHLGHLVTIMKLLDLQKAGIKPIILLANWHAFLNQKGSWEFLKKQTINWEKGMESLGIKAKFIRGTDFQREKKYIDDVMILAINTTVSRGIRSMQAVGRNIESAKISQLIYPLMQIQDIKVLDVDFVVSGLEQRKIHALGIESFSKINFKKKPIFIHTGIITGLKGKEKMSSSSPNSMISIRDKKKDIERKIKNAHCSSGETEQNPILEITRYILFPKFEKITVKRDKKFGKSKTYNNYETLENDFKSRTLHPLDLKNTVIIYLDKLLSPIRKAWR